MPKVKTYLRVARNDGGRTRFKVEASAAPNYKPLTVGSGVSERPLPTIAFAVVLDIDDFAFTQAARVIAEIQVPNGVPVVAAEALRP